VTNYAVVWSDDGGPARTGRLVVDDSALVLHGGGTEGGLVVQAAAISRAYIARDPRERLRGCPTLVLERRDGPPIRIGAFGLGVVGEVLELVAALSQPLSDQKAIVVVPLRRGGAGRARELITAGPPFDPADVGLRLHDVYVTDREAIFVLEGPQIESTVERLLGDVTVWRRAAAWRSCLGGRPRLADHVYSWADGSSSTA
jgi:hypothetical protein